MCTPLLCATNTNTASQFNSQSYSDLYFSFFFIFKARIMLRIESLSAVQTDGTSLSLAEHKKIFRKVSEDFIQKSDPHEQEDRHELVSHLEEELWLEYERAAISCLHITVRCRSLEILENLWRDYTSGKLNKAAQRYLVTDEVLKLYNLQELKLSTNIDEEEYRRCKEQLTEIEGKQGKKEREREREREKERERERERERGTDRQTDRQRHKDRQRDRDRQTDRQQTDRQTEPLLKHGISSF